MSANSPSETAISPPSLLLTMHERLASQSAVCKLVGLVLAVLTLAFVSGRTSAYLFLPLAPLLSALPLDAAYAARASQVLKLMRRIAGGEFKKDISPWEMIGMQMAPQGLHAAVPSLGGILLFSVWPFYLTLGLVTTLLGAEVLAPKPLPVLPRNPVASGDLLSVSQPGKYPVNGLQSSGQLQGIKPPQPLRLGPPTVNRSGAALPVTAKSGPVFTAKPPQATNQSLPVVAPPVPKTTSAAPVLPVPTTPVIPAAPLVKTSSSPTPVAVPKATSQSPSSVATPPLVKPATAKDNGGVKQP